MLRTPGSTEVIPISIQANKKAINAKCFRLFALWRHHRKQLRTPISKQMIYF